MRWVGMVSTLMKTATATSLRIRRTFEKKIDDVLDEDSYDLHGNDVNYYSEIIAFDLRYDGDAFDFAPYRDRSSLNMMTKASP